MNHPRVGGLQLTIESSNVHGPTRHHWITTSTATLNCKAAGEVKIFDSLFTFCDKETIGIIYDFYQCGTQKLNIAMSQCRRQGLWIVCYCLCCAISV